MSDHVFAYLDIAAVMAFVISVITLVISSRNLNRDSLAGGSMLASVVWLFTRFC